MEPPKLTLNVVTPTLVWMVSLYALKLETFKILQLVGFILMVLGALIFNETRYVSGLRPSLARLRYGLKWFAKSELLDANCKQI